MSELKFRSSGFAILDVTKGRAALARHFKNKPTSGPCPEKLRLPIVIHGFISGVNSRDDGVSQEFTIDVTGIECGDE